MLLDIDSTTIPNRTSLLTKQGDRIIWRHRGFMIGKYWVGIQWPHSIITKEGLEGRLPFSGKIDDITEVQSR